VLAAVAATFSQVTDRLVRVPGLAGRRLGPAGVSEEAALIALSDQETIRLREGRVKGKTQDVVVGSVDAPLDVAVWVWMEAWTGRVRAWTSIGWCVDRSGRAVERSGRGVDGWWMIGHDRTCVRFVVS